MADLAVVIVNYRTPELAERCVASVPRAAGDLSLEVVVVDNGSADGSAERLRAALPGVEVLAVSANRGFGAGVNAGVQATAARHVAVLNPDTELRPGALAALSGALDDDKSLGVVAPALEYPDGIPQSNAYRRFPTLLTLAVDASLAGGYAWSLLPRLPHPHNVSPTRLRVGGHVAHVMGAAFAFTRDAWAAAGPFDERFFLYLEETEWQRRVTRAGFAVALVPQARVVHAVRAGDASAAIPSPHYATSAYRYFALQGVPAWRVAAALHVAQALTRATIAVMRLAPGKRDKARMLREASRRFAAQIAARGEGR